MILGKRWLFTIGNEAKIRLLEKGRKCPGFTGLKPLRGPETPKQVLRQTDQMRIMRYLIRACTDY